MYESVFTEHFSYVLYIKKGMSVILEYQIAWSEFLGEVNYSPLLSNCEPFLPHDVGVYMEWNSNTHRERKYRNQAYAPSTLHWQVLATSFSKTVIV